MADEPTREEVFRRVLETQSAHLHVAIPGRVQTFNKNNKRAAIIPQVWPHGDELPVLPNVPVVMPGGAGAGITFNVKAGDPGLLIIADVDIRHWLDGADPGPPVDLGRHGLQDATFHPGLYPRDEEPDIGTGDTIVVYGTNVHLGDHTASKAVVHEALLSALDTFLAQLDAWGQLVETATGVLWTGESGPSEELATLRAGITAGSYESPSVKVED